MNVAVDNTGQSAGSASTSSLSISSFAVGAGAERLIWLAVSQFSNTDRVPSATFNGSENFTVHDAATVVEGSGVRRVTLLYLKAPSNVTGAIAVSWSGAVDEVVIGATSWSGVDQTTPLGTAVTNTSGTPVSSSTVNIPTTSDGVAHDGISADADASFSMSANLTQRWKQKSAPSQTEGAGQSTAGTGGTVASTWSNINQGAPGGVVAHIGALINASAGGPGAVGFAGTRAQPGAKGPRDRRGFLLQRMWDYTVAAITNTTIATDVGSLVLNGFASVLNFGIAAGVGALTLTGFAPSAVVGTVVAPNVGALTLTGFAPSVVVGTVITPGVGVLTLTGQVPSATIGTVVFPGVGALTLSGFAPALNTKINTGVGALTLNGFSPTLDSKIVTGLGALTLSGFSPSANIGVNIQTGVGALTLGGFAPTLGLTDHKTAFPGLGALTLSGFAPGVLLNVRAFPGVGALTLAGLAPTILGAASTTTFVLASDLRQMATRAVVSDISPATAFADAAPAVPLEQRNTVPEIEQP